jgi:hypothetical protein
MKYQTNAPAYPCTPIKNEFGSIFVAVPGFTKYEQVLLSIVCAKESNSGAYKDTPSNIMKEAQILTDEYFKTLEKLQNAKENDTSVIQM